MTSTPHRPLASRSIDAEHAMIEQAHAFGLDVEPERCDFELLARDLSALDAMPADQRPAAVARLNDGEPLRDES